MIPARPMAIRHELVSFCVGEQTVMKSALQRFWNDERGATAIEYGLIAALISVAIISAATTLGTNVNATFRKVANNVAK